MNEHQQAKLANPLFLSQAILNSRNTTVAGRIVARHGPKGREALEIARPTFPQRLAIKRAERAYLISQRPPVAETTLFSRVRDCLRPH
ncbi:hypothetical protein KKE45_00445 [Patescibacteria group bacterium]|nr:hypothetical protein [Patescibacteria group bacterium]